MKHLLLAAVALVASLGTAFAQDTANGEKAFNVCRPCHQVGPDAVNMLGPPLNGLDGRKAGSLPDFPYSAAMIAAGKTGTPASKGPVVWNEATFTQYIANPAAMIPNINMMFAGISGPDKDQKIKDLWAYLGQFDADGNNEEIAELSCIRLIWLNSHGCKVRHKGGVRPPAQGRRRNDHQGYCRQPQRR